MAVNCILNLGKGLFSALRQKEEVMFAASIGERVYVITSGLMMSSGPFGIGSFFRLH